MNKLKIFLFLFLFTPLLSFAQDIEGGIFMGVTNYQGDLVDDIVELKETKLAFGLLLRYHVNDLISLRSSFLYGTLTGTDANSSIPTRITRGLKFKTAVYELSLNGEFNFLGNPGITYMNVKKKPIYPYVSVGIGVTYSNPLVTQGDDIVDPEKEDYQAFSICLPVSAGVKFKIYDRSTFGFEAGFRTLFNDYIDGISVLANPDRNDWYMFVGLNISVFLARDY